MSPCLTLFCPNMSKSSHWLIISLNWSTIRLKGTVNGWIIWKKNTQKGRLGSRKRYKSHKDKELWMVFIWKDPLKIWKKMGQRVNQLICYREWIKKGITILCAKNLSVTHLFISLSINRDLGFMRIHLSLPLWIGHTLKEKACRIHQLLIIWMAISIPIHSLFILVPPI